MTTRRTGKPLPYITPRISGTTRILVGRLGYGVPAGTLTRPGSDDTTAYVLAPDADGGWSFQVLRAVGGKVADLSVTPAFSAAIRAKASPGV